jgi:hypothetical protein
MKTKKLYKGLYDSTEGIVKVITAGPDSYIIRFFNNKKEEKVDSETLTWTYRLNVVSPLKAISLGLGSCEDYIDTVRNPFIDRLKNYGDAYKIFDLDEERYSINNITVKHITEVYFTDRESNPNSIRLWINFEAYDEESEERVYHSKDFYVPENVFMALKGDLDILYSKWKDDIIKQYNERKREGIKAEIESLTKK